jgi:hypothetical protein
MMFLLLASLASGASPLIWTATITARSVISHGAGGYAIHFQREPQSSASERTAQNRFRPVPGNYTARVSFTMADTTTVFTLPVGISWATLETPRSGVTGTVSYTIENLTGWTPVALPTHDSAYLLPRDRITRPRFRITSTTTGQPVSLFYEN